MHKVCDLTPVLISACAQVKIDTAIVCDAYHIPFELVSFIYLKCSLKLCAI